MQPNGHSWLVNLVVLSDKYTFALSLVIWSVAALVLSVIILVNATWMVDRGQQFESSESSESCHRRRKSQFGLMRNLATMVAKASLILLALGIAISFYVAFFANHINTDNDANNRFVLNQSVVNNDHSITLDNQFKNLFWFIQISDTHFNFYNDRDRAKDLQHFCHHLMPLVNPPVLVHTGDITDSRSSDPMGSDQFIAEWIKYNETRVKCLQDNPNTVWLDIRGNHDNFNVYKTFNAYYKNFTVQAKMSEEGRSYRYEYKAADGNSYSFIGVDACLIPGIKRPFNFIGQLDNQELSRVRQLKQAAKQSEYTIWFGHYPTSSISNANDLREIINGPYLCGHYHNFHNIAPKMFTTQSQGYLEAELGDWKANRMFRIGVIDGGLFNFADFNYKQHYDETPLIVISNPRSVLFRMENYEPYWRTARSSHVRALVFSKRPLERVSGCIHVQSKPPSEMTDCVESFQLSHVQGPLWTAPWSPDKYKNGLYYFTITAWNDHDSAQQSNPFSLDKSKPQFTLSGRISLRVPFQSIGLYFFSWSLIIALVPLLTFKLFTYRDNAYFRHMFNLSRRSFFRKLIFKIYLLAHIDQFLYPSILFPIYLCIGPWMVGRFVNDHIGVVFIWGTYIDGYVLPVAFTYILSSIFLFIFHIPFVTLLACLVNSRLNKALNEAQLNPNQSEESVVEKRRFCDFDHLNILLLFLIVILQGFFSSMYYFAYGHQAMWINVFTWMSLVYIIQIVSALKLTRVDFQHWL